MEVFQDKIIQTIAVYRPLQLGDLLTTIPAIRALRAYFPKSHITLIGLPWSKQFVERFNEYFDEYIEFLGFPGIDERSFEMECTIHFIKNIYGRNFDLLLQMAGNGNVTNSLLAVTSPKIFSGYFRPGNRNFNPGYFLPYPIGVNEIHRHMALMRFFGIPVQGEYLEFPLNKKDEQEYRELSLPTPYICIHAGARGIDRRWDPLKFAQLGKLILDSKYSLVLTGIDEEKTITTKIDTQLDNQAINLTGKTSLGSIGMIIKNASLVIANDTGISHLAVALKTKSIIISLSHDLYRWRPLNTQLHQVIAGKHNALTMAQDSLKHFLSK